MDGLSRISVGAKLALVVGVLAAVVLSIGGAGLWSLDRAVDAGTTLMNEDVPAVRTLGATRAGIGNMRRFEKDLFLNLGDEAELERYHKAWRAEVAQGRERLNQLRERLEPNEREAVGRMLEGIDGYARAVEAIVAGIRTGKVNDPWAANKAMEPSKGAIRAADKAFEELTKSVVGRMEANGAALQTLERRTQWMLALTTLGGLALGLALAWAVAGRITKPLREAVAVLDRVAAGDLQVAVQPHGSDEPAQLLHAVRRMQQSLTTMVRELRGGIESVAAASDEIARGNADLSARTEHQAANLQQTAASMEQIGSSAESGADSARQAHALAQQASAVATQGGGQVREVVATMAEIEAASRRIGEITSVIDGIAFQTNILALNAAVEAARAGEQGRGFAVVASEVRALAQRSAEAARQIKALIGDSVARVEAGSARVQVAGRTIDEVVQQVGRVHALIGEVTAAAGEQGKGISEIGQAVGQLDQTTQQNAALVEQTAAAAESLKQQAQRLAASVATFRVEGTAA